EDGRSEHVPIGRPLPGVVAVRGPGDELHLGGPGLALGYLQQLELTRARFVRVGQRRLYRSGDRVRVQDGTGALAYIGRVDDELKISGHRIHPTEVEGALLSHPSVREVAVIARSSHGRSHLVAYTVADVPAEDLREHAAARLTGPAVPHVVTLDRLPRTGTGKIDRRALSHLAAPGGPEPEGTPEEKLVAAAWAEVLGRPVTDPGADFFAIGGQSLQAVAVANRLSAALGRTVPATLLFQHPTVSGLAAALSAPVTGPVADTMLADAEAPLPHPAPAATGDRVLVTGATGFVGAHLLAELCGEDTEIWCTVRGPAARLAETAAAYGLPDPTGRVTPITIDLGSGDALPDLAVTRIWHAAATVSLTRGYDSMRAANVEATRRVLELACRKGSTLHHVSTVAVGAGLADLPEAYVPAHDGLRDGYQRGKWAAERLAARAAEAGLPVTVYRLGRVTGPIARSHVNPADLVWRLVRAGLAVGSLPDLDVEEPWTPVDWVAETAVRTAATGRTGVVNLVTGTPTSLREVWRWIADERGLSVEPLPAWRERVAGCGDPEHLATGAFFATHKGGGPPPAIHSGPLPVAAPEIDRTVVLGYLAALTSGGGPAGG
ncbi:MAG TPA: SDR family oxidoreductase, partial [Phytomonospora sp.]